MKPLLRLAASLSFVVILAAVLLPTAARTQPLTRDEAPEPLRPWVDWVLQGHEQAACPFLLGAGEQRQCLWPSTLSLDLAEQGGSFSQQWLAHRPGWATLPGDGRLWPQQVQVDGRDAVVVPREGAPAVRIDEGRHRVTGTFLWAALPPLLQVPPQTGLVDLRITGRPVPSPRREESGRLWLRSAAEGPGEESRAEIVAHRKVTDDIPLTMEVHVELQVAGRSRELALGQVFPPGWAPLWLNSLLPARLETDGRLRVQARPGRWTLTVAARSEGPVTSITPPAPEGPWPAEEVWVFEARPWLRLVEVEGVTAVDPQQTSLPPEWRALPAYLVPAGHAMDLVEKRRGDSDPLPDQLSLRRAWWLDFDGGGFSIHDEIKGRLERSWRLDILPPARLGRAAINGVDQLVTVAGAGAGIGVEVRQAELDLAADSRLEGRSAVMPAVGWDHDFGDVSGILHLPPGWRLLHAWGVDDASPTWIAAWTLLDLFLVLILAISVQRLWGWPAGALALATLTLTWIEPGAPHWLWALVLVGEALRRALPGGRARQAATLCHRAAVGLLAIFLVPFMVQQVRAALYPAFETLAPSSRAGLMDAMPAAAPPAPAATGEDRAAMNELDKLGDAVERGLASSEPLALSGNVFMPDPRASVQTGPGLPDWGWRTAYLSWRGPVERTQRLGLLLLPRWVNAALGFLRVALLGLLLITLLVRRGGGSPARRLGRVAPGRKAAAVMMVLAATLAAAGARAEIPGPELLDELRQRLLQAPECFPDCADCSRMVLEAGPSALSLRLELHGAAETAVPLPGGEGQWSPEQVLLDGAPAAALARTEDGRLWLSLPRGLHQVVLRGPLPDRETVSLPLPLRPHRLEARVEGWRLEGLQEDGVPSGNLQLVRLRATAPGASPDMEAGHLPAFVRIERQIQLGLQWNVHTRVMRVTPPGEPVVLEIPLLDGESVLSEGVTVRDGRAVINMGAAVTESGWVATLPQHDSIRLRAPEAGAWAEVWTVAAGPIWHLVWEGVPPVRSPRPPEPRLLEWRPWPGEEVLLRVDRPAAEAGRTLTIDSSVLTLTPGQRATDASLALVLRSSRGDQHSVTLPETAVLQSVAVDGEPQPIRQDGRELLLPIRPGRQEFILEWRQSPGVGTLFRAPEVRLGDDSVNATVRVGMPRGRWTLLVGGPRLGPAVLFWSFLVVALLISIGLGRISAAPLRWRHWLLLSLGLAQVSIWIALPIVAWILALAWRRDHLAAVAAPVFNAVQLALALLTLLAMTSLLVGVEHGLLGLPEMQIAGNGSSAYNLQWYLDRSGEALPRPWVVSLPLLVYRLAMLAWALWLAQALLGWLRWGWGCFRSGELWRPMRRSEAPPVP